MNLFLHVRKEYFDLIKSGKKTREYRKANDYWLKRLGSGNIERVIICEGYPKKGDTDRILEFPWRGYTLTSVLHKEFGPDPIFSFAIKLER